MKAARNTVLLIVAASLLLWTVGSCIKNRKTIARLSDKLVEVEASRKTLLEDKLTSTRTGDVRVQGKIEAAEAVAASPQVEAPIARVLIEEGALVEAGQILVELDDTGLRARLAECMMNMHSAVRRLENIERLFPQRDALYRQALEEVEITFQNEVAAFHQSLAGSARDIERYDAEIATRTIEVERLRELADEGLESQTDLEKAVLELRVSEIAAKQARDTYADLRRKIESEDGGEEYVRVREAELKRRKGLERVEDTRLTQEDLEAARAAVDEGKLMVQLAAHHVEGAHIRAAIRGIVTAAADSPRLTSLIGATQIGTGRALSFEEVREVGKRVGPQDVLFVIEGLDKVVVKVDVDEMDINRVRIGRPARITGVGFAGKPLRGEVASISPKATYVAEGITTFETTVTVLDELGAARLGMSAEVDILVGGEQ